MGNLIGISNVGPFMTKRYIDQYGFDTKWAQQFQGKDVLIRTDKGLWRPNAQGYTYEPADAGRFDLETAWDCIKALGPEKYASIVLPEKVNLPKKKKCYLVAITATVEIMAENEDEAAETADLLVGPLEAFPGVAARHQPKLEEEYE